MLTLGKYSLGMGDRFARQAKAQLRACIRAAEAGVDIVPVWNKSHREHMTIGSEPPSTRCAADEAVAALGWKKPYYVDADHINLHTIDAFVDSSDFFTIDVADAIGRAAADDVVEAFVDSHPELTTGTIEISGIAGAYRVSPDYVLRAAGKFLSAVEEAGRIYRHIESAKGKGKFITEISMDETDSPQTPAELLVIFAAIADEGIPVQTIAPKFSGRFNKGVDYSGDLERFEREFREDLAVIAHAIEQYNLPDNLKLSVHSGSDKFSIYRPMREALLDFDAGVHLKTAGTTWLEELTGLAEAGGEGLTLAKEIYRQALEKRGALCAPYAAVIAIDAAGLPAADIVDGWSGAEYAQALRNDPACAAYNPNVRQLLHVAYKIAAQMGDRYLDALEACEDTIAKNVTGNLYERHARPLFVG